MAPDSETLLFTGSNWEDLTRLETRATIAFAKDALKDEDDREYASDAARCYYIGERLEGAALDWFGSYMANEPNPFASYDTFLLTLRNAFGVNDEELAAHRRGQFEQLNWRTDVPSFFAEFDRLTVQLGMAGDATRISELRARLPQHTRVLLAEQALNFTNYDTMRNRIVTMWALDPRNDLALGVTNPGRKRERKRGKGKAPRKN